MNPTTEIPPAVNANKLTQRIFDLKTADGSTFGDGYSWYSPHLSPEFDTKGAGFIRTHPLQNQRLLSLYNLLDANRRTTITLATLANDSWIVDTLKGWRAEGACHITIDRTSRWNYQSRYDDVKVRLYTDFTDDDICPGYNAPLPQKWKRQRNQNRVHNFLDIRWVDQIDDDALVVMDGLKHQHNLNSTRQNIAQRTKGLDSVYDDWERAANMNQRWREEYELVRESAGELTRDHITGQIEGYEYQMDRYASRFAPESDYLMGQMEAAVAIGAITQEQYDDWLALNKHRLATIKSKLTGDEEE